VEITSSSGLSKGKFCNSTWEGMLFSKEQLVKGNPKYVPHLTKWGKARESVLLLCDGTRTLREIESEMYKIHSDLFRTPAEAAKFVAEVVLVYSE
jgi:hypothetical protein